MITQEQTAVATPVTYTLHNALKIVMNSVTPGAITQDGRSYVSYDEEYQVYRYMPDLTSVHDVKKVRETWILYVDQLDRLVIHALNQIWVPVSNFIIE